MHDIHTTTFHKQSQDIFKFQMDWIVALAIFGTLVAIFDIYWVLRLFLCHFVAFFRKKQSIDEVSLEFTICKNISKDFYVWSKKWCSFSTAPHYQKIPKKGHLNNNSQIFTVLLKCYFPNSIHIKNIHF